MSDLPPITIVATTWLPPGKDGHKRLRAVNDAVASWRRLLYREGLHLHIADDGTGPEHQSDLMRCLRLATAGSDIHLPLTWSQQQRHGVGASLNIGLAAAFERSPLVFHAVDDWRLTDWFNLEPWAALLIENPSIGMIRFFPHPDLTGSVKMFDQGWGLLLDRHHYVFATRPFLAHRRFFDAFGPFLEDANAYEVERDYNERFCASISGPATPDILLALPERWEPIESVELAGVDPRIEYKYSTQTGLSWES